MMKLIKQDLGIRRFLLMSLYLTFKKTFQVKKCYTGSITEAPTAKKQKTQAYAVLASYYVPCECKTWVKGAET